MGSGSSSQHHFTFQNAEKAFKAAALIQRWYRRYMARLEMRRRCTWNIFQSIEYAGQQDQVKLHDFFSYLVDHFTPSSHHERDFLNRMFTEERFAQDVEKTDYESIEVPDSYTGPHLSFPLLPDHATALVEAFRLRQQLHARYVLNLLYETRKHLAQLPNINRVSTCYSEEITVCGDLHGQLDDLIFIFHKNGLPSPERAYVFNGDFVDRGKDSVEVLMVLFAFVLVYPKEFHLNRGNHEDHLVNLRYGFTKEVMQKYKIHGKKILRMLQDVFCWLPLATLVDEKVLVLHGGVSDRTDLDLLAKLDRHKIVSTMRCKLRKESENREEQKRKANQTSSGQRPTPWFLPQSRSLPSSPFHPGSGSKAYKACRSCSIPCSSLGHKEQSRQVRRSVDLELERCRQQAGFPGIREKGEPSPLAPDTDCDADAGQVLEPTPEEWKQVVDILWSDPMAQEGCKANTIRGGGCYFGPDVTEKLLEKYKLQFLIRSHECKPEGYEFCHNRKVLTIFSASNYYEVGSNRGAYVKLGPALTPHIVQYQANKTTHRLTMRQRISRVEESALRALRRNLFAHSSDLLVAFQKHDMDESGMVTLSDWAVAVESVVHLGLPWRMLRPQLVNSCVDNVLEYKSWLESLAEEQLSRENIQSSLLEKLYRNRSNLETIFRVIDSDHSGFISLDEFRQTWKLFSSHMNIDITDDTICDLARSIDFNKDGRIDINEFLEAFRLVEQSCSEGHASAC